MIKDRKKIYIGELIYMWVLFFIGLCMLLEIYFIMYSKCSSRKLITNLLLFFNIFNFIIINECTKSELYVIVLGKIIIAKI